MILKSMLYALCSIVMILISAALLAALFNILYYFIGVYVFPVLYLCMLFFIITMIWYEYFERENKRKRIRRND